MTKYNDYADVVEVSAQIGQFAKNYLAAKANKTGVSHGEMLDSLTDTQSITVPAVLQKVMDIKSRNFNLDSLGLSKQQKGELLAKQRNSVLTGLANGIDKYKERHGGDMPDNGAIASAVTACAAMLDDLQITSNAHSAIATVPALTLVTIALRIANSLPLVAQLPNPNFSNSLPLVNVRYIAKNDRAYMKAGEYVDGEKAPLQFIGSHFEFEMAGTDNTRTLTPKTAYLPSSKKPDNTSATLPIIAGAVTILVNGIPVADDRTANNKVAGSNPLVAIDNHGVDTGTISGSVDMTTNTISITFERLPAGAEVTAIVYADYEREGVDGNPIIREPRLDISTEFAMLHAHPTRASYTATVEALSQIQAELGVDVRSAFVAIVTSKQMLEENMTLLNMAKRRAIGNGLVYTTDLTRGSDMTTAFNNTRDQAIEILPTIDLAIQGMNGKSNHAANGYDIYVSGKMAILLNSLPDDTRYVPTNNAIGATNQVVKIGTLRGNINVYCVPETKYFKLFNSGTKEVGGKYLNFGEMLIVARNAEPPKSMFVGFTAMPIVTKEYTAEAFKSGVTFAQRHCAQMNPIRQYGNQSAVIHVLNVPASLITF